MAFDVEEDALVATCHHLLDMYAARPHEANGDVRHRDAASSSVVEDLAPTRDR